MGFAPHSVQLTPADEVLLTEKQRLVQEYLLVKQGLLDSATYQKDWQAFARQVNLGAGVKHAVSPSCIESPSPVTISSLAFCGDNLLTVPTETQITYYYCGPATVQEMLISLNRTVGPLGEPLSQSVLAEDKYLVTDTDGGTNFTDVVPNTLNAWTNSGFYVRLPSSKMLSGEQTYVNDFTTDIDNGHPVAAGVYELNGSTIKLTGHPLNTPGGLPIEHWIAIKGYTNYGGNTTYDDSIYGTHFWSWSPNVPSYSTVSSSGIIWPLISPYGIIW